MISDKETDENDDYVNANDEADEDYDEDDDEDDEDDEDDGKDNTTDKTFCNPSQYDESEVDEEEKNEM